MGEAPPPERMDGVGHLARDAELLKLGTAAARVGISTDLHLSLGVSQPEEARCARQARRLGISVIRRTTGGAAVLVRPGDLLWTRVLALDDPEVGRDFVRAYGRLGNGVTAFLREFRADAAWTAPAGLSEELCLLGLRGCVLAVDGRTVGGAAQHRTARALLHHGVVSVVLDHRLLVELFGIPEATLRKHLAGLGEFVPGVASDELAHRLGRQLFGTATSDVEDCTGTTGANSPGCDAGVDSTPENRRPAVDPVPRAVR